MPGEKYLVNCPTCGPVEGYLTSDFEEEDDALEADVAIEEATVQAAHGATSRVRCPRCGKWLPADRVSPA